MIRADRHPAWLLTETRVLLRAHGLRPHRTRGQHFLVDPQVRDRIVEAAGVGPGSAVVEVGPGTGVLTEALLLAGASVLAVEVDRGLAQALRERLRDHPGLTVHVADALDFDFSRALREQPSWGAIRVVANIPYYITTPLILRLLTFREAFAALFLTVQREVADRLTAPPGRKAYGALTVACRYWADVRLVLQIPPTAFFPVPQVDSALVRLDLLPAPRVPAPDPDQLFRVVRAAFGQRRKTLRNALGRAGWDARAVALALARAGIEGGRRGETLSLEEFARVNDALPAQPDSNRESRQRQG